MLDISWEIKMFGKDRDTKLNAKNENSLKRNSVLQISRDNLIQVSQVVSLSGIILH